MLDRLKRGIRRGIEGASWCLGLLTLRGREVTHERAAKELRALRLMVATSGVVALVGLSVFAYSWPIARARAARLLYERQELNLRLSQACYAEATNQIKGYMERVESDPSLTQDEKDSKLHDAAIIGMDFVGRRDACTAPIQRAQEAKASLPHRLSDSSVVKDPVTGLSARVDAPVDAVASRVMAQKLASGEVKVLTQLAHYYGRKGAERMPSRFEWSFAQDPGAQAQDGLPSEAPQSVPSEVKP